MTSIPRVFRGRSGSSRAMAAAVITAVLALMLLSEGEAAAAQAPVGLGTAKSFAVLAGSTVTNTGVNAARKLTP